MNPQLSGVIAVEANKGRKEQDWDKVTAKA